MAVNRKQYPFFEVVCEAERQPSAKERSIAYLTEHLSAFVGRHEKVLVFFPPVKDNELSELFGEAIRRCGAEPVFLGSDTRWKTLLFTAFSSRAETVIGMPFTLLGLSKLARTSNVPLSIRNVVLAGYPCSDWVVEGISRILDCRIWQCFSPISWPMVGGFSCQTGNHLHIRDAEYAVDIIGEGDSLQKSGEKGDVVLSLKSNPDSRIRLPFMARLCTQPCSCGNPSAYLTNVSSEIDKDEILLEITQELLLWTSILDCRSERTESGLSLEIVTFIGEKLPKLPSCAKLIVRAWDPAKDIPFEMNGQV